MLRRMKVVAHQWRFVFMHDWHADKVCITRAGRGLSGLRREGDRARRGDTARQLCARAVHWCAGGRRRGAGGPRERNAAAASNDRVRVASFTRSAVRRTTADVSPSIPAPFLAPMAPHYTTSHMALAADDARFSTRSPLEKLSAPHSATIPIRPLYHTARRHIFHSFLRWQRVW